MSAHYIHSRNYLECVYTHIVCIVCNTHVYVHLIENVYIVGDIFFFAKNQDLYYIGKPAFKPIFKPWNKNDLAHQTVGNGYLFVRTY